MIKIIAKNIDDLPKIAETILNEYKNERVFAFYGKMGSGKTTFIKELCKLLGVEETITSPTFALINEYAGKEHTKIYHFDFYRIENQEEAYDFGYEEYFYSGEYCLIEWPELIENLLPETYVKINIIEQENFNRFFIAEHIVF